MFEFLSKYLLLILIIGITACSKHSDTGENNTQENSAIFSGLSRYSIEQESLSNSAEANAPKKNWANVVPGYDISFPFDHASHPEFAVEWWYITANLTDTKNNTYALQWTLFRFASDTPNTPWANTQQYMGHVGLRDGEHAWFEERFARGGVGNAGISTEPFNAFIDEWQWLAQSAKMFPSTLELTIDSQIKANLNFTADKPLVKHGEQGFSRKLRHSDQASYYYSQPHIQVSGELQLPNGIVEVSGNAWFDHEWTSQYMSPQALGWDWFSIHFDDGSKLMLFNMRSKGTQDFWSGTLVTKNGATIHLDESAIQAEVVKRNKVEGRMLPLHWSIQLPKQQYNIQIAPMQTNQWNPGIFSYYEGGTVISGSHTGVGFIELTGY
ncbi:lipocalin-like domain-containing protein [uncultured Paraglaciecola sp.]|uniref:lipocalin-like domain-containing protein n=1 Tax=uncultured Paraglaciecola sp. TaxID=1765024 RepID=UPI0025E153D9|nr:lipocalin-like domain-containing protein [uncultured Paraglaciecola sp.]